MFSSISTNRLPVQAKLPSLQLKVNSNYFLPVKYISNLVVIVDRFLSKACVCKDKISAFSYIIEGHRSKLKHYYKLPSLQHPLETFFCISPCSETPLAKCDQIHRDQSSFTLYHTPFPFTVRQTRGLLA